MEKHDSPPEAVDVGAFSAASRSRRWERARGEVYDVLVIGGGITGVGIAYDAAGRGLRVLLVEAADFGQGTSSRSSRLIHGGLRYLENFHFGLVFEALAERSHLLRLAPHLVRPLPFLYPIYPGEGVGWIKMAAGMWAYDALALFRNIRRHRMFGRAEALRQEPGLRAEGLRGAARYFDAQVDDARLTLAVARAADRAGAVLLSYARVTGFDRATDGRVTGARVEDVLSNESATVRARLVIGAVGPWTDELRRLGQPDLPPRLRPTKGVHIQVPRARVGNRGGITFRSPFDRRVMFVLPWGEFTYVGTTDTDYAGSSSAAEANPEDVRYLLASLNHVFPRAAITSADVLSTWTGVRPLVAPDRTADLSASQTSREHEIWREAGGLLMVAGGKLTTFRTMAADVVDTAARILEEEHGRTSQRFDTARDLLPGAPHEAWNAFVTRTTAHLESIGMPAETARHLTSTYGTDALAIARLVDEEPALAAPLLPPHPHIRAEIVHSVRNEMALTLQDVLRRRLHLFYDAADGAVSVADSVARRIASEPGLSWSEERIAEERERYARAVSAARAALTHSASRADALQTSPPISENT